MALTVGGRSVEAARLGNRPVSKLMLGDTQVWPTGGGELYRADWSTEWGAEWTQVDNYGGDLTVAGGSGIVTAADRVDSAVYARLDGPAPLTDFIAHTTATPSPGGNSINLALRWDGALSSRFPRNGYWVLVSPLFGYVILYRVAAGSPVNVKRVDGAANPMMPLTVDAACVGDTVSLAVSDGAGSPWVDLTWTDPAPHLSGNIGLGTQRNTSASRSVEYHAFSIT